MQVGCEMASAGGRRPPPPAQSRSRGFRISRQSGQRGLRVNFPPSSGFFFFVSLLFAAAFDHLPLWQASPSPEVKR